MANATLVAPSNDASAPEKGSLGERLRRIRRDRGWTLADVAEKAGLAVSTISKVERDRMNLTYDKFMQLAAGLGVDVGELFGRPGRVFAPGSLSVTRFGEAERHETDLYVYEMLGTDLSYKGMVPMMGRIRARERRQFSELVRHAGEEFLIVLDGALEVHLDGRDPVVLERYDSIYFDSAIGHVYVSAGDVDAIIVVVCAPSPGAVK